MRAAAKALNNPPDVYGIGIDNTPGGSDCFEYAFIGAGGTSRYGEDGKSLLNSEVGVQGHAVPGRPRGNRQDNPAQSGQRQPRYRLQPLFIAGKLAMLETGSWFPTILKQQAPDIPYGVAKLPMADASIPYHNGFWPDAVVMFKQSQHQDAAVKFLEYQFNKENRLPLPNSGASFPSASTWRRTLPLPTMRQSSFLSRSSRSR